MHELFEFRLMQTDPNWSNFLYNQSTGKVSLCFPPYELRRFGKCSARACASYRLMRAMLFIIFGIQAGARADPRLIPYNPPPTSSLQLELIDFGATREYTPEFMDVYGKLLDAAIEQDREAAIRYSNELGYFTGQESEASLSLSLSLSLLGIYIYRHGV